MLYIIFLIRGTAEEEQTPIKRFYDLNAEGCNCEIPLYCIQVQAITDSIKVPLLSPL